MVESIANIVRAWPAERMRDGQPYLALELICGQPPTAARPGDAVVDQHPLPTMRRQPRWTARSVPPTPTSGSDAYTAEPCPRVGALREPGYVMRFRKERSFVYSLIADGERARVLAA